VTNRLESRVVLGLDNISAYLGEKVAVDQADVKTFVLSVEGSMPLPADTGLVLHEHLLSIRAAAHLVVLQLVPKQGEGICRELRPPMEAHMAKEQRGADLHLVPGDVLVRNSLPGGADRGNWLEEHEVRVGFGDPEGILGGGPLGERVVAALWGEVPELDVFELLNALQRVGRGVGEDVGADRLQRIECVHPGALFFKVPERVVGFPICLSLDSGGGIFSLLISVTLVCGIGFQLARPNNLLGGILEGPRLRQAYRSLTGGDVEASSQSVTEQGKLIGTKVRANLQVRIDKETDGGHWVGLGEVGAAIFDCKLEQNAILESPDKR
jgi:hypothetical protein